MKPVSTEYMRKSELVELCFVRALKIKRLEEKLQNISAVIAHSTDETAVGDMQILKGKISNSAEIKGK